MLATPSNLFAIRAAGHRLAALEPRCVRALPAPDAVSLLEDHLALVASWCRRAAAEAWDCGRLSAQPAQFTFQGEIEAVLRPTRGAAASLLEQARRNATACEQKHDQQVGAARLGLLPPLAVLRNEFDLSGVAADILLVVAAPSVWGELARVYGVLSNDPSRPLCDELLVATLLSQERAGRVEVFAELQPSAPLIRNGLVRVGRADRPFAPLTVNPLVVRRLLGDSFDGNPGWGPIEAHDADVAMTELGIDGAHLEAWMAAVGRCRVPARLVVRGRNGSGRTAVLAAIAREAGRRLGIIDCPKLLRTAGSFGLALTETLTDCRLLGWLPCLGGLELLPSSILDSVRDAIRSHPGPVSVRWPSEGLPPVVPGYLEITMPSLNEGERAALWAHALHCADLPTNGCDDLARDFAIGPGTIRQVVGDVATLVPEAETVPSLLRSRLRQQRTDRVAAVATRVTRLAEWENLILPKDILSTLHEFVARVRHRQKVYETWGFDRVITSARGLTALFSGGPGTGKSMAAGVIARAVGYELYRVDLAQVMSKWVGETEKQLAALFDAAEEGQIILVFDEADSLFATRTEVKSSNDRFANLEVNYLLTRLDSFDGIAILTTNLSRSIDRAFRRRMSLNLSFPHPDEETRERLWRTHLPASLPVDGKLDLNELARRYPLSGGYIRNVTLRAAFLAANEGRGLTQADLEKAVRLEYLEGGKLEPSGQLE